MKATKLVAVLAAAGLVLAACGDDDEEGAAETTAAGAAVTTDAGAATTMAETATTMAEATATTAGGATTMAEATATTMAEGGATTMAEGGDTTMAEGGATTMAAEGGETTMAEGGATTMAEGGDTTMAEGGDTTMAEGGATTMAEGGDTTMAEGGDTTMAEGTTAEGGDTTVAEGTTAGSTETTAAAAESTPCPTTAFEDVTIGVVTDVGRVDDGSFNQSAWEGAQEAAEAVGGSADYIETTNAADYATNIGQFIDSGANIIITVGFALGEATAVAAGENPEVCFIGVDQFQAETLPNVTGLVFPEDQAGFLAGALAASLSESGTIAAVLGTDQVPPVVAFKEGYENGAEYINPDIEIISTYHPGGLDVAFNDPEFGGTTARQAIDNGADVVFGAGGETGNGALREVAADGGDVLCIGVDTDQWETVPEAHPCLVTSAVKRIDVGIVDLVELSTTEGMPTGNYFGEVGLADFHDLADRVPEDVQTEIDELTAQVISGEVPTGYEP